MTGLFIDIDDYIEKPNEGREIVENEEYMIISSISNIPGWEDRLKAIEHFEARPRRNGTFTKIQPTTSSSHV